MCEQSSITFYEDTVTEAALIFLHDLDQQGAINLDAPIDLSAYASYLDGMKQMSYWDDIHMSSDAIKELEINSIVPTTRKAVLSFESNYSTTELHENYFKNNYAGMDYTLWSEACDGYNADELHVDADGSIIRYDVDYDNGKSYIHADVIQQLGNYPPELFKMVVLDLLEEKNAGVNSKLVSSPLKDVMMKHKVGVVLTELDAGRVEPKEAFDLIAQIRHEVKEPSVYLVMIAPEFVDGIGYIKNPDGEFGGEDYVELPDALPVILGSYKCNSESRAISEAAREFECSKEILFAKKVKA